MNSAEYLQNCCRRAAAFLLAGVAATVFLSGTVAAEQSQPTRVQNVSQKANQNVAPKKVTEQQTDGLSQKIVESSQDAFQSFLQKLKPELQAAGLSNELTDSFLSSIHYLPRVIELDRRQPESRMSHETYLQKVIPEWKVKAARKAWRDNYQQLKQVEAQTGVNARFIVALWGKESHFGKLTGKYHVPSALATLAFDGRRAAFFKRELIKAAQIVRAGHIDLENMRGSWAGAMGHCQFMPSSFLHFAKDGDGDGLADIWTNKADVFASIANYLIKSGWDPQGTWGRQVKLTRAFSEYQFGKAHKKSLAAWQQQGVRRYDLSDLPKADIDAYLIAPGGEHGRIYLVYNNYDVLLKWNRSSYFATGVGYLADRVSYPPVRLNTDSAGASD